MPGHPAAQEFTPEKVKALIYPGLYFRGVLISEGEGNYIGGGQHRPFLDGPAVMRPKGGPVFQLRHPGIYEHKRPDGQIGVYYEAGELLEVLRRGKAGREQGGFEVLLYFYR